MPETSQYDEIGELYEQVGDLPFGIAERATVLSAVPDLRDRTVLDVGCGTGTYARLFRRAGARQVLGVDPAREMLAVARAAEEREPLGIAYERYDGLTMPKLGEFDVVAAIWPLSHVGDRDSYDRMVANLAENLVPGGQLLIVVPNPDAGSDRLDDYPRYGMTVFPGGYTGECVETRIRVHSDPPFEFSGFGWPSGVLEESCAAAGLTEVRRYPTVVPEPDLAERGSEFWAVLLESSMFAVFTARRGEN
ncbi:class I SAM-dependent methyltransferase [Amycolatopsis sp. CA-230715]|uniref:class I SAM-dependent methyltransferase n=1 Tax=Amycolatopsis sp. CA-230715 TaxID=2745196 RepID=UPI001C036009|nr:class I SAM-dependent methyltransferase [Amycolatopsis sp. CA-230715]QWF80712.1 Ubiquinone biosynthesis O-methyltransferase [Amycolatopsis sp. CA-230715]